MLATLIGLVVLRTRGHAFVIITIALLLSAQIVATNWRSLTNGSDGITLELPFWDRDIQNIPFYLIMLVLLALTVLFSAFIRRTKFGTGLVAIREDEGKAAAIGVNTTRYKVTAFAASAFFIGVAGGVYAYFLTFLNPVGSFSILGSVTIVLSALAGGRGTLYGPVVGAFIVGIGSEMATVYGGSSSRVLIFGLALTLIVLFLPNGLLPTIEAAWRKRRPVDTEYTDQAGALGAGTLQVRDRELAGSVVADEVEALAGAGSGAPLLEVKGAAKAFGGLVAVDGADLTVRQGSITALIGPNGSGKTTLFNLVTGAMKADAGEVWLDGTRIDTPAAVGARAPRAGPHLPDHAAVQGDDRPGEPRRAAARREVAHDAQGVGRRLRGRPGPRAARVRGDGAVRRTSPPAPCRTASRSSSSWHRSSCSSRGWCCSTSRPGASTRAWSAGWSRSCATSTGRA